MKNDERRIILVGLVMLVEIFLCRAFGQYHDPTLDVIANNDAAIDNDLRVLWAMSSNTNSTRNYGPWDYDTNANNWYTNQVNPANTNTFAWGVSNYVSTYGYTNGLAVWGAESNLYSPAIGYIETNVYQMSGTNTVSGLSLIPMGTFNGYSYLMDLSFADMLPAYQQFAQMVRQWIVGIVWLGYYITGIWFCIGEAKRALAQRQIQGTAQTMLGVNLTVVVAIVFLTLFIALIKAAFVAIGASQFFAAGSPTGAIPALYRAFSYLPANVGAWETLTAFVPIAEIMQAFLAFTLFCLFVVSPAFVMVQVAVLAMIV